MFVGHLAVALGAKRVAPDVPAPWVVWIERHRNVVSGKV